MDIEKDTTYIVNRVYPDYEYILILKHEDTNKSASTNGIGIWQKEFANFIQTKIKVIPRFIG